MNRIVYILYFGLFLQACIQPYDPAFPDSETELYSVYGLVSNQPGYHIVEITKATSVKQPYKTYVPGCKVEVIDRNQNIFIGEEFEPGRFRLWIDSSYLRTGSAFSLNIQTPDGETIVSAFDTMPACPVVDTLYYDVISSPQPKEENDQSVAIQFFINLSAAEKDSRYFRWELEETWEYHSPYPIEYYYDGRIRRGPLITNRRICWRTETIKQIFTLDISNYGGDRYLRLPLHSLNARSQKLMVAYSVNVIQYALSKSAYTYWEKLKSNAGLGGNLYEKQPSDVLGNLSMVQQQGKRVLGYFSVSSKTEKRFMFKEIESVEFEIPESCIPYVPDPGWMIFNRFDYPVYIVQVDGRNMVADKGCFDCTEFGGSTQKPIFWPW